ncbi:MAG: sigma-70 family RNA polymerase sigma factor [Vicinamibacterales bacterium]
MDRAPQPSVPAWTAFEAEAMPHVERLYRLALWWERDRGAAEDLVQDTLVQALQSFHRFTPGTNCRAWLATIMRHVRSNTRRSQQRSPLVEDPGDLIADTVPFVPAVPQQLTDDDMVAALRGLPEQYQDIILMCDVEELSYKDIAQALGIPMGTVMSRLHRGRGLLRQALVAQRVAAPGGAARHATEGRG